MKLSVVAVGRLRDARCAELCDDYGRRIARYTSYEMLEVKEARGEPPARSLQVEGDRLLAKLPTTAWCVSLDERGRTLTSTQLASWLDQRLQGATRDVRFVVGGAWGTSPEVKARCKESFRLSSMTLPHELARVVLVEQLYRAWTILRREPYHHA